MIPQSEDHPLYSNVQSDNPLRILSISTRIHFLLPKSSIIPPAWQHGTSLLPCSEVKSCYARERQEKRCA